jgi:chromosome segregation ATPase
MDREAKERIKKLEKARESHMQEMKKLAQIRRALESEEKKLDSMEARMSKAKKSPAAKKQLDWIRERKKQVSNQISGIERILTRLGGKKAA